MKSGLKRTYNKFPPNPINFSSHSFKITGKKEHYDILPVPTRYGNNNKSFQKVIIIITKKQNLTKNKGLPDIHLLSALFYSKVMDGIVKRFFAF